ncbi:MAG: ABC transporter permease subunit [Clostridia bacterium]|nr:ABC transporter permease subunit [Clostridia bacterium]
MLAVFKRELRSYLYSPVGYVYLFFFAIATAFVMYMNNVYAGSTDTTGYFTLMRYMLIVAIPMLAMKTFPEERKNKTDQILITAPISIWQMVLGKFFAAYAVFLIGLIPTIIHVVILSFFGYVEVGIVIGNYIGVLFVGAAFLAISMLMSVITESMIVAFIMSAFALAVFAIADIIAIIANNAVFNNIVSVISITQRCAQFSQGLFDVSSIIYFLSIILIFLFLTVRIIDKRRWS